MVNSVYDVIGIGVGPSNLSLSALLNPVKEVKSLFLDRKDSFIWHEGMLMPEAQLQVSFLKDLVTLVDPTNSFSFLNFLSEKGRLYRHFNTKTPIIKRKEFNQYYQWAIDRMDNVKFGHNVTSVIFDGENLKVSASGTDFIAKNIAIGVGTIPCIPEFAKSTLGSSSFHSSNFLASKAIFTDKRIAVVGGGQSGAEIVNNLLNCEISKLPQSVNWISRRYNYLPLEDSPFTNELYTPGYSKHFYRLNKSSKLALLDIQKLTSDGISEHLLQSIYNKLYELEVIDGMERICHLLPGCEIKSITSIGGGGWKLSGNQTFSDDSLTVDADIVIFATGYQYLLPDFLNSINGEYRNGKELVTMNRDFSIPWEGAIKHNIYIQNGARNIWGVPNPNLSLNAWRSAVIVNSITGKQQYCLNEESSVFNF